MFKYQTRGVCSRAIYLEIDDNDVITHVEFEGGCRGNTKGVATLAIGQNAKSVAKLLANIPCQGNTSCPDQLSKAINAYYENKI